MGERISVSCVECEFFTDQNNPSRPDFPPAKRKHTGGSSFIFNIRWRSPNRIGYPERWSFCDRGSAARPTPKRSGGFARQLEALLSTAVGNTLPNRTTS